MGHAMQSMHGAQVMAGNGVDLIRTWGFLNGAQDPYAVGVALQPSVRCPWHARPGLMSRHPGSRSSDPSSTAWAQRSLHARHAVVVGMSRAWGGCAWRWRKRDPLSRIAAGESVEEACSAAVRPKQAALLGCAQIGVYDELSLQRLDLVLSEAAKNGVYIILPLVNYWSDLGGMQWYVDQVGKALHKPPSAPFLG